MRVERGGTTGVLDREINKEFGSIIIIRGNLTAFGEAIYLKDQSFLWTEGRLDLAEVGDMRAIM